MEARDGHREWRAAPDDGFLLTACAMLNKFGQRTFSYDKIHLVPFGEYEPFPFIHQVVDERVRGSGRLLVRGETAASACLQTDTSFRFSFVMRRFIRAKCGSSPIGGRNLLVNISNDGWFGTSAAAEQHLRMARVRAVENRRWILRDTNSGISASIDPYGTVTRVLHRDERGSADLPYDFRTDRTLYVILDDWFAWMCVVGFRYSCGYYFSKGQANSLVDTGKCTPL